MKPIYFTIHPDLKVTFFDGNASVLTADGGNGRIDVCVTPISTWQPVETAPVEKGLIDIFTVGFGSEPHRVCDCYYDPICDEWRTSRPAGRIYSIPARFVTHWMPLPTPPNQSTE